METLVVGAGAMGRWLARALVADGPQTEVAFLDSDQSAARTAADALDGRAVSSDADESFDAVCVAVPIPAATEAIATYAPLAERAVYDVTGVMRGPVDAMRDHAPERERVSFHPLFAPDKEPGNVPVVADAPGPVTDDVREALASRGNDLFETTAAEHDEVMETVQARTHAAVMAYALAGKEVPDRYQTPISAALGNLADRVTAGEPRVYADIQATFEGAEDIAKAADRIATTDHSDFERLFEEASGEP